MQGGSRARDRGGGSTSQRRSKGRSGRWTAVEHENFLKGVEQLGRNWTAIKEVFVPSRTMTQIRTHAQKYFKKVEQGLPFLEDPYQSSNDDGGSGSNANSDVESCASYEDKNDGGDAAASSSHLQGASRGQPQQHPGAYHRTDTEGWQGYGHRAQQGSGPYHAAGFASNTGAAPLHLQRQQQQQQQQQGREQQQRQQQQQHWYQAQHYEHQHQQQWAGAGGGTSGATNYGDDGAFQRSRPGYIAEHPGHTVAYPGARAGMWYPPSGYAGPGHLGEHGVGGFPDEMQDGVAHAGGRSSGGGERVGEVVPAMEGIGDGVAEGKSQGEGAVGDDELQRLFLVEDRLGLL